MIITRCALNSCFIYVFDIVTHTRLILEWFTHNMICVLLHFRHGGSKLHVVALCACVGAMPAQQPIVKGAVSDQCMILQADHDELPQSERDLVVIFRTHGQTVVCVQHG